VACDASLKHLSEAERQYADPSRPARERGRHADADLAELITQMADPDAAIADGASAMQSGLQLQATNGQRPGYSLTRRP
jgi:hypothetical protein